MLAEPLQKRDMKQLNNSINKVLIVEDHVTLADGLQREIESIAPHAEVCVAHSLEAAQTLLREWRPVLVIMDFKLGDRCITEILRSWEGKSLAPFILGMSHCASLDEASTAIRGGFTRVLDKPFTTSEFLEAVFDVVENPAPLPLEVGRMTNPGLYSDTGIDLKKLIASFESSLFASAESVTTSKRGLGRLLGISRQLVQYHLSKRRSD